MSYSALTSSELHAKIDSGEPMFILDVRNTEEYNDWKIEGKNIESINIPYFDFLDENEEIFKDLPKDREIIVICAKGGSAQMVAEMLDERGYQASYLKEGMMEWSQFYHPVTIAKDENFKLIQINRVAKGCLSYMVVSHGQAMIVDSARHTDMYLDLVDRENAQIAHVMDTHLHADHITGGHTLVEQAGGTYYISSGEMQDSGLSYEALENYDQIQFGSVNVKVLAMPTPGHTPGSVSFVVNDRFLLSGDTIFVGGLGRPDLGGKAREWAQSLYDTVFTKIVHLPDETLVLPAHYSSVTELNSNGFVGATLGDIRRNNKVMQTEDREEFTDMVASVVGATPPNYEEIVDINRGLTDVTPEKATELEIGPNRCAVHHN